MQKCLSWVKWLHGSKAKGGFSPFTRHKKPTSHDHLEGNQRLMQAWADNHLRRLRGKAEAEAEASMPWGPLRSSIHPSSALGLSKLLASELGIRPCLHHFIPQSAVPMLWDRRALSKTPRPGVVLPDYPTPGLLKLQFLIATQISTQLNY